MSRTLWTLPRSLRARASSDRRGASFTSFELSLATLAYTRESQAIEPVGRDTVSSGARVLHIGLSRRLAHGSGCRFRDAIADDRRATQPAQRYCV